MASYNDKEMALARVYSGAMLSLAEERGQADSLRKELLDLSGRVEADPAFQAFLSSPMVDVAARERSIEKLFRGRYSDLLVDSLQVLNRKERAGLLGAVVEAYGHGYEELRRHVEVEVRTASPLTKGLRASLIGVIAEHTGREVTLIETVEEELLGGMIVHIGDEKFDVSVATHLSALARRLTERAQHEIHGRREYVEATSA